MLSLLLFFVDFVRVNWKKEQAGGESGREKESTKGKLGEKKEQAKSKIDKMEKILGRQR